VVKGSKASSKRPFYAALAVVAVVGAGLVGYAASRPREAERVMMETKGNPDSARPYVLGRPDAPVTVLEFADFECPACGSFATVTEPDVRQRLIDPGIIQLHFYDFPLSVHRNTWAASNAAACADEQGKFWAMHDAIFATQDQWNGEATSNPKKALTAAARQAGLDLPPWEQCYDARKYQQRVANNQAEALRRDVRSTPTFVIAGRAHPGALSYDQFKAAVDSALNAKGVKPAPAAAALTPRGE
jgi:protein-disulfide isomerase